MKSTGLRVCIGNALYFSAWLMASMDGDIVNVISFYCALSSGYFDASLVKLTVCKMMINCYFFSCKHWEGKCHNPV